MAIGSHDSHDAPGYTSLEPVALSDLKNPLVRGAVVLWHSLCNDRRFPAHADLDPRMLASFQDYMILLKVIEGGEDFEYRFVGKNQAQAYKYPVEGYLITQTLERSSKYGPMIFAGYRYIQQSGIPFAMRGWVGEDYVTANFSYFETVALPLGPSDDYVDYIVVFSAFAPRDLNPVHT